MLLVKLAVVKPVAPPPGKVTLLNKNKSPSTKPCAALFTVTVADPLDEVKVQEVRAVSRGLIS